MAAGSYKRPERGRLIGERLGWDGQHMEEVPTGRRRCLRRADGSQTLRLRPAIAPLCSRGGSAQHGAGMAGWFAVSRADGEAVPKRNAPTRRVVWLNDLHRKMLATTVTASAGDDGRNSRGPGVSR
jgi:hypothetical protein